jgi:hypothetical protein
MGTRRDGRIDPGQKLGKAISARAWNRAQDAADIVLGQAPGVTAETGKTGRELNVILVRNDSGEDVPIHGVLGLSAPAIDPAGGELTGTSAADSRAKQLSESVIMVGVAPAGNTSRFCVTLEPIAAGGFGRAAIAGAMALKVKLPTSGQFFYAVTRVNDRTQLLGASCGPVRLLWHESGPGDNKWAVAILS